MKKYKIRYNFDGYGDTIIEAKSKKEAEEKFAEGCFVPEMESGGYEEITEIGLIK